MRKWQKQETKQNEFKSMNRGQWSGKGNSWRTNEQKARSGQKKGAAATAQMARLCSPGRQEDGVRRWEGNKKGGEGVRDGRRKSRRVGGGLTRTLGSTDKDGGQMLSPVFSGWEAWVSTPNIGKWTQLRATLVCTRVYVCVLDRWPSKIRIKRARSLWLSINIQLVLKGTSVYINMADVFFTVSAG